MLGRSISFPEAILAGLPVQAVSDYKWPNSNWDAFQAFRTENDRGSAFQPENGIEKA
ncbi:MAG: hypothetical protein V8T86_16430 [Victivallis sp.]